MSPPGFPPGRVEGRLQGIINEMNLFKDFEKKLESLFEGVLLRAFRAGVHPVELGKKLVRELEGQKTIGVTHVYVPNRYEVGLAPRDYSRFESYQSVMATELENLLLRYILEKGYAVLDRPVVKMSQDRRLREGEFWIRCSMKGEIPSVPRDGTGPEEPPAVLELADGADVTPSFVLGGEETTIGRSDANDVVLLDPNVSRLHAKVEAAGGAYVISDSGSTNGTWVNEERVAEAELSDGDVIRLGSTNLVFRRSSE